MSKSKQILENLSKCKCWDYIDIGVKRQLETNDIDKNGYEIYVLDQFLKHISINDIENINKPDLFERENPAPDFIIQTKVEKIAVELTQVEKPDPYNVQSFRNAIVKDLKSVEKKYLLTNSETKFLFSIHLTNNIFSSLNIKKYKKHYSDTIKKFIFDFINFKCKDLNLGYEYIDLKNVPYYEFCDLEDFKNALKVIQHISIQKHSQFSLIIGGDSFKVNIVDNNNVKSIISTTLNNKQKKIPKYKVYNHFEKCFLLIYFQPNSSYRLGLGLDLKIDSEFDSVFLFDFDNFYKLNE